MYDHAVLSTPLNILGRILGLTGVLFALSGCVANSSNPEIYASSATMNNEQTTILLQITNPGGRNLTIHTLEYELSHGEMGFPLASDTWIGHLELPAKGEIRLPLIIKFDDEPIEDDSTLLHLNGQLEFNDHTGFLGLSSMDLTETSFQIEINAQKDHQ